MYKKNNSNSLWVRFLLILFLKCNYIFCTDTVLIDEVSPYEVSPEASEKFLKALRSTRDASFEASAKCLKAIQSIFQYSLDRFVYWTKTLSVVTDPRIERIYNALNDTDFSEVEKKIMNECEVKTSYIRKLENEVSQLNNTFADCKKQSIKCLDIVNSAKYLTLQK